MSKDEEEDVDVELLFLSEVILLRGTMLQVKGVEVLEILVSIMLSDVARSLRKSVTEYDVDLGEDMEDEVDDDDEDVVLCRDG